MNEWPFLKVFLGELLGDKRFAGELRRTGHHVFTVLQGLWWEVRRTDGTATFSPEDLDDLAIWTCTTAAQVCDVFRLLSGPKFETTKRGKTQSWLRIEGLPAEGLPEGPIEVEVTGWKERNNVLGRARMDRYLKRKRGEAADGDDPDDKEDDEPTPADPPPVAPSKPIPQYGLPFSPVQAAEGVPGVGTRPGVQGDLLDGTGDVQAPVRKPRAARVAKSGRLYHIDLVRDEDTGECTWTGIDEDDRAEWATKFGAFGVDVDAELDKMKARCESDPKFYREKKAGGAWLASIRYWMGNAKTWAAERTARGGPSSGSGRTGGGFRFRGDDASAERIKRLEQQDTAGA